MTEYIMDRQYDIANGAFSTVKREEIVRCRDCKHYKPWVLSRPENGGDCVLNKVEVDVWFDGFCAWGERETINKTGDIVTHDNGARVIE